MAKLHLTLRTRGQLLLTFLLLDLGPQTVLAEDMLAGELLGVLTEDVHADGTLKLFVKQSVCFTGELHGDWHIISWLIVILLY